MEEGDASGRMTYGNYLRLEEMLGLQNGPSGYSPVPCNDEKHFIIVHQANDDEAVSYTHLRAHET